MKRFMKNQLPVHTTIYKPSINLDLKMRTKALLIFTLTILRRLVPKVIWPKLGRRVGIDDILPHAYSMGFRLVTSDLVSFVSVKNHPSNPAKRKDRTCVPENLKQTISVGFSIGYGAILLYMKENRMHSIWLKPWDVTVKNLIKLCRKHQISVDDSYVSVDNMMLYLAYYNIALPPKFYTYQNVCDIVAYRYENERTKEMKLKVK